MDAAQGQAQGLGDMFNPNPSCNWDIGIGRNPLVAYSFVSADVRNPVVVHYDNLIEFTPNQEACKVGPYRIEIVPLNNHVNYFTLQRGMMIGNSITIDCGSLDKDNKARVRFIANGKFRKDFPNNKALTKNPDLKFYSKIWIHQPGRGQLACDFNLKPEAEDVSTSAASTLQTCTDDKPKGEKLSCLDKCGQDSRCRQNWESITGKTFPKGSDSKRKQKRQEEADTQNMNFLPKKVRPLVNEGWY
jgi:hypothetical protein